MSPDIVGPVKNGGIGTHCYYLARTLASAGFNVSLLFTGPLQNRTHVFWKDYYNKLNINYNSIDEEKIAYELHSNNSSFLETSYLVYEFLKNKSFDFIHFQEWQANALVSIQAKETTKLFDNTIITVTMHSSTQWQEEGMMKYSNQPLIDMKLKWAEEYCAQNCDFLISPSKYMFQWAKNAQWILSKQQILLQYCYIDERKSELKVDKNIDKSHLIFFGRLETRKGIEYFVESIVKAKNIKKISFLGKISMTSEGMANKYLANKLINIDYKIYSEFDTFDAIKFIKKEKALVVIPSLLDNYPYTIIEMIVNNVNFICSSAGGIPEMVDSRVIFDINDKNGLVDLLDNLNTRLFKEVTHKYKLKQANADWISFHNKTYQKNIQKIKKDSLVSICVPYYNYPEYLPYLLESINNLAYKNYEVIVVNDGSSQYEANSVFKEMENKYSKFQFFSKRNSGVGDTRNFAASKASGKYIIFMDSDNLASMNMINIFVEAIEKSCADIVTCYFSAFNENYLGIKPQKILYKYLPLGACKEVGVLENIYGDANFIVKKEVFDNSGGFGIEKETSWEDWEFLANMSLQGYIQKVIPKSLFWYRHTEEGFSRNTNLYKNHRRIIECYNNYYPKEVKKLISGYVLPNYYNVNNSILNRLVNKILPINSKRRNIMKAIIKKGLKK